MSGLAGTALRSHRIASILAIGILLTSAHGAAHAHGPALGSGPATIAAGLIHGGSEAPLEAACGLCRNRLQEREFALRVAPVDVPERCLSVTIPTRCDRDTPLRRALACPARAPPHHA